MCPLTTNQKTKRNMLSRSWESGKNNNNNKKTHIAHGYKNLPEIPLAAETPILVFDPTNPLPTSNAVISSCTPHSPNPDSINEHSTFLSFALSQTQSQSWFDLTYHKQVVEGGRDVFHLHLPLQPPGGLSKFYSIQDMESSGTKSL